MQRLPPRLLVVEDDLTVARALSRTLARAGCSVAVARSCGAARSLAQSFDLGIFDLDLPDGNGVDLARSLMKSGKVPSVLFFTSCTDLALLARARCMGPVVLKAHGTSSVLAWLAATESEALAAPESGTTPSAQAHDYGATSPSALRRSRAR